MSTAAQTRDEPRVASLEVSDRAIVATLTDGRVISVPLSWSWRLEGATPAQRNNFVIHPIADHVHWADVDEDLSARGFLTGTPAPRPRVRR